MVGWIWEAVTAQLSCGMWRGPLTITHMCRVGACTSLQFTEVYYCIDWVDVCVTIGALSTLWYSIYGNRVLITCHPR